MSGTKGRSGRKALSLEQHLRAGSYRADRHGPLPPGGRDAVLAGANVLQMPALDVAGLELAAEEVDGREFVARLRAQFRDWSVAEEALLALLGQQFDRLREIRALIKTSGIVTTGRRGRSVSLSVLLRAERQTTAAIAQLLKQINLRYEAN